MVSDRLKSILTDAHRYIEAMLWVKTDKAELVPMQLNAVQRHIRKAKREALAKGRKARFLIPKFRRGGVTTYEQALSFALAACKKRQKVITLAESRDKVIEIFEMVTRFYEEIPEPLRPHCPKPTTTRLSFPSRDSHFVIGTAGSKAALRGGNIQRVHGSEVSAWLDGRPREVFDLLMGGITEACRYGEVVLESTNRGDTGWWFDTVTEAALGKNEWTVIPLYWWLDPALREPCIDEEERQEILHTKDDRERWLIDEKGLDAEQIKWRRAKRSEAVMRRIFPSEYMEILEESFLSSAFAYFSTHTLNQLTTTCREPCEDADGLTVWHKAAKSRKYVIGADCASGVQGGDYSAAGVIDIASGEQVARLHGRWRPDTYGHKLYDLGRAYNNALICVERNPGGGGEWVLKILVDKGYGSLYQERRMGSGRKPTARFGWTTDDFSRPILLEDLRGALEEGHMQVNDREFLHQARIFEQVFRDGRPTTRYEARSGQHDDLVFAWGLAWQARKGGGAPTPSIALI